MVYFISIDENYGLGVFAWFLVVWLDGVCLQMFLFGVIILSTGSFHTVWNSVVNNKYNVSISFNYICTCCWLDEFFKVAL